MPPDASPPRRDQRRPGPPASSGRPTPGARRRRVASSSSSALPCSAPATTRHAFAGQGSGDGEADALAGTGDDGGPARQVRGPSLRGPALSSQVRHGVGDLAPAVVDGQRVGAVGELEDVGDRLAVPVLLERRLGDRLRDGVVLAAHDQQQRSAARLSVATLAGECGLKLAAAASKSGLPGAGIAHCSKSASDSSRDRVAEGEPELLGGQRHRAVLVGRVLEHRQRRLQRRQRQRAARP